LALLYWWKEKVDAIKKAVEEAVQLEQDRTKQTVSEERVRYSLHGFCIMFAILPFL